MIKEDYISYVDTIVAKQIIEVEIISKNDLLRTF
jgi:hypothetical protein